MLETAENPVKFLVGEDALENLAFELERAGCARPMLVCDDMSYRLGYMKILLKAQKGTSLSFEAIDKRTGDVAWTEDAERIAALYKNAKCDGLVALGKTSAITVAKCAKVLLTEGVGSLARCREEGLKRFAVQNVPLFVVPTNFGSGIECARRVRIATADGRTVYDFRTRLCNADTVLIDERLTDIFPPQSVASYGLYALAMGALSMLGGTSVYAEPYAVSSLRLSTENTLPVVLHNADKHQRVKLLTAIVLAGYAYDAAEEDLLSGLANVISDRYKANFGNIFAILFRRYLPMADYGPNALSKLLLALAGENEYAACVATARPQKALDFIEAIYREIGEVSDFKGTLTAFGAEKSDFASIAEETIALFPGRADREISYAFIVGLLDRCCA